MLYVKTYFPPAPDKGRSRHSSRPARSSRIALSKGASKGNWYQGYIKVF